MRVEYERNTTGFSLILYTKMAKILSFCYVFNTQPELKFRLIFFDPEVVHLIRNIKRF